MVPSPARGQGDRWERWGRKSSPVTTATTRTSPSASFGFATGLSCRECGKVYELGPHYACEECFGPLEVRYDYPALTRSGIEAGPPNMWRYAPLLPVPPDIASRPTTEAGYTKLIRADNLAHALGMRRLWIKDDRGNPTHSFKDRVVAVALAAATEMGFKVLACPSTGNLANAVAAAAARAGVRSVVMVPADLELQKIITTSVYGGTFVTVDGTYDDVNRLASELAGEHPDWAFVNVNVRPYYAEGSKTLGFEIAEQLGWELPDAVVQAQRLVLERVRQLVREDHLLGHRAAELARRGGLRQVLGGSAHEEETPRLGVVERDHLRRVEIDQLVDQVRALLEKPEHDECRDRVFRG